MPKTQRKVVTVRLAPKDQQLLNAICDNESRSYGEKIALWLQAEILQQKEKRQEEQSV